MERTTAHLTEAQMEALRTVSRQSSMSADTPDMSQAEVLRKLVDAGLEASDGDLWELMDERTRKKWQYERLKDENWCLNMREGFKNRLMRELRTRFESGWTAEGIEKYVEAKKREARLFYDDAERRADVEGWLDRVATEATEAVQTTEYDPVDPEEALNGYQGVSDGEDRAIMPALTTEAADLLTERPDRDADALATRLSNEYDVDESVAAEAVREARKERRDGQAEGLGGSA